MLQQPPVGEQQLAVILCLATQNGLDLGSADYPLHWGQRCGAGQSNIKCGTGPQSHFLLGLFHSSTQSFYQALLSLAFVAVSFSFSNLTLFVIIFILYKKLSDRRPVFSIQQQSLQRLSISFTLNQF